MKTSYRNKNQRGREWTIHNREWRMGGTHKWDWNSQKRKLELKSSKRRNYKNFRKINNIKKEPKQSAKIIVIKKKEIKRLIIILEEGRRIVDKANETPKRWKRRRKRWSRTTIWYWSIVGKGEKESETVLRKGQ